MNVSIFDSDYSIALEGDERLGESPLVAELMIDSGGAVTSTGKRIGVRYDPHMPCAVSVDTKPIRKQWVGVDVLITFGGGVYSKLRRNGRVDVDYQSGSVSISYLE